MKITVYCGATLGNQGIYQQAAQQLGQWIIAHHHELVYGGGSQGLMGVIANTVLQNGGKVIGIMPKFLVDKELAHSQLSELIIVENMSQRKDMMSQLGDVFIALPGGPGTLEEITDMISWSRIGKNDGPCILFNVDNYYEPLRLMYDQMVARDFLTAEHRQNILFSSDLLEISQFIENYQTPINVY